MDARAVVGLSVVGVVVGFFIAITIASSRHEARMRRAGKWDEAGPKKPVAADDTYPLKDSIRFGGLSRAWERFNGLRRPRWPK